MISYFNTHRFQKVSQTWYTLAQSNIFMPSHRLSLLVYLLSITSPLWQVWQQTTKTSLQRRTPLSALILKHSERVKLPDHQQPPPKQSHRSETKWSLIIFSCSRINIYERASKAFPFPIVEAGSHQSRPCPTPAWSCVWGSDGVGLGVVAGRVRRRDGVGFNASALHVGDQLVGDLGQHVFRQPRHAQHMVASAVHVVSERDKLWGKKSVTLWKEPSCV